MKLLTISLLLAATASALPSARPYWSASGLKPRAQALTVVVGGPQDTFAPNSLTGAVGDIVQFQFSSGNHTATQSTEAAPCTALAGGMHSGHIPLTDGQTEVGTFNMPITSTDPMFVFCATGPHCQEGMVMVINPASAQQVVDFVKNAQATQKSVDGSAVVGGTAGKLALAQAAFVPAPAKAAAAAAPPAAAAAAGNASTPAPPAA
ncbi:hypothetical protein P280DRAFT_481577 [Massarina eburnea CBS 473.64]|uniref:Cupredoxin n=1 Tax=Massarina eburnea CBS 473.64 TaxID=1395130 RepID=A0A6A6RU94_9PLEO|nr:hypothetical protein P280DRAFT_481577 [Massarina eburnea CBS 473.64]